MHRRFLFPLATGVVALLAISPVFAAEPSPAKAGSGPGKATTTTAGRNAPTTGTTAATAPPQQQSPPPQQQSPPPEEQGPPPQAGPSPGPPPSGGPAKSTSECGQPQTNQGPAPQAGQAPQNHPAGDAGTVDIERASPTDLRVAKTNPNNGWQPEVTSPSGPRITVKFTHPGYSPSLIHFAATMDQAGRMIHTRVQSCG
jgi:hypothetical protein